MDVAWADYQVWLKSQLVSNLVPEYKIPSPNQIVTDSRKVKQKDLFLPLVGENFNGHDFIEDACKKGCIGFFYEVRFKDKINADFIGKGIAVKDTLATLQQIAKGFRAKFPQNKVFALTGSVGKTTTKEILKSILGEDQPTLFSEQSFNNEVGLPLTLIKMEKQYRHVVVEMGARHKGDITKLCDIAQPDFCGILNVKNQHLSEFQTMDGIFAAKTEIFRDSPRHAQLVVPSDDLRLVQSAKSSGKKFFKFGRNEGDEVRVLDNLITADNKMTFRIRILDEVIAFSTAHPHVSLPQNVACACAFALAAGVKPEKMRAGVLNYKPIKGRFNIQKRDLFTVIDDSYNANPESMTSGMRTMDALYPQTGKVLILGDMQELGTESKKCHVGIGTMIQDEIMPELLITVGKESEYIAAGALQAGMDKARLKMFPSVKELLAQGRNPLFNQKILYIKGAHAMELDKFVAFLLENSKAAA